MTNSLYKRTGLIKIQLDEQNVIKVDHHAGNSEVRGIDFSFVVERNLRRNLNQATVNITNLAESTRSKLEATQRQTSSKKTTDGGGDVFVQGLEIFAGYLGKSSESPLSGMIFRGGIVEMHTKRDSVDVLFEIRAVDGINSKRASSVSIQIDSGTPYKSAIESLISDSGLKLTGNGADDLSGSLPSDMTFSGSSYDAAEKIARSQGFFLSVQNGAVQLDKIVSDGVKNSDSATTDGENVYVLTYKNGLIQAPSRGKRGFVSAKCLMLYDLIPGHYVRFKGTDVDGYYRIHKAKYEGDTSGSNWFVTIDCKEV